MAARTYLAALAIVMASLTLSVDVAEARTPPIHPCRSDDRQVPLAGRNCIWDAYHMGHKRGDRSYWLKIDGSRLYIKHVRAWKILEKSCFAYSLHRHRWISLRHCQGWSW